MYRPIRDYAVIGNLRSAVLVSRDGSVDWAPAPYIDSPSIFAALLDDKQGGYYRISLVDARENTQRYIKRTNVLTTTFRSDTAALEVTDYIPIEAENTFLPDEAETTFKLKRRVKCLEGTARVRVEFMPRFDYARGTTELSRIERGVHVQNEEKRGVLVTHRDFSIDETTGCATAEFDLNEGEYEWFVFRYNTGSVDISKDSDEHHNDELLHHVEEWREWLHASTLDKAELKSNWHRMVMRSMLCLKILFFEPVGTVAAAPTTSLPESMGGVRNWDYRFTWIRDSALIFKALFKLGHSAEAKQYLNWLTSVANETGPEGMRCMYGLRGEKDLSEYILSHLDGYEHSRPVRVGNSAHLQQQWDLYGSVLDIAWNLHELEPGSVTPKHWSMLRAIAEYVTEIWHEPDESLWEVRGGAAHFVYSKVMCWVALDRAIKIAHVYNYEGNTLAWENEREAIKHEVLTRGYNKELQSFVMTFDGAGLDAALLLLPVLGFIEGTDPKMVSTIDAIDKTLSVEDGLLRRYTVPDGLPGGEGVFLLASFWFIDALVHAGFTERALTLFEKMCGLANHVGLYSEEMDVGTGAFLGNFPQAYTHIGLINSGLLLANETRAADQIAVVERGEEISRNPQ